MDNNVHLVLDVLEHTHGLSDSDGGINARLRRKGFTYVGIPGSCTALIGAMVIGSFEVVEILLKHGANPFITDKNGNNPLMCACVYGRLENVRCWVEHFQHWDLEYKSKIGGRQAKL